MKPTKQSTITAFLEIVAGQTDSTARKYLDAASWNLNEAIQLYYASSDSNEVRTPLPVVRDTLYDDATLSRSKAFRASDDARNRTLFWKPNQETRSNLASLYSPPYHLMFNGPFEKAKEFASNQGKWLLVNLQSIKEFSSHMLNRDTWGNGTVSQTISNYFTFWQVYDDTSEYMKVCNYYKLNSTPIVLVIDPITGQKMRSWSGMVQPENLLDDLVPFMDSRPMNQHTTLSKRPRRSHTMENLGNNLENSSGRTPNDTDVTSTDNEETFPPQKPEYPPLPEEPETDKNLICRVGIRLPDGRRLRRNFLRTDPIQLLWSFCHSQLEGAETSQFHLTQAITGASKILDYESLLTFEESGIANSMISVILE